MQATNSIFIKAPPEKIMDLVGDVQRWQEYLPHYRYVRALGDDGSVRTFEMGASRSGIPVSWAAEFQAFPESHKLRFTHVGGITKGMYVEWRLMPSKGGTNVEIYHDLRLRWPPVFRQIGELVITKLFIEHIASRTLRRFKELAESSEERHSQNEN